MYLPSMPCTVSTHGIFRLQPVDLVFVIGHSACPQAHKPDKGLESDVMLEPRKPTADLPPAVLVPGSGRSEGPRPSRT